LFHGIFSPLAKNNTNKNMKENCNCPKCGAAVKWEYEAPYQEYPGAKVWGGDWSAECASCGWLGYEKPDLSDYNVRENTRGW
jgi:hypothetical protein